VQAKLKKLLKKICIYFYATNLNVFKHSNAVMYANCILVKAFAVHANKTHGFPLKFLTRIKVSPREPSLEIELGCVRTNRKPIECTHPSIQRKTKARRERCALLRLSQSGEEFRVWSGAEERARVAHSGHTVNALFRTGALSLGGRRVRPAAADEAAGQSKQRRRIYGTLFGRRILVSGCDLWMILSARRRRSQTQKHVRH